MMQLNKACGVDNIPAEVLKNDAPISVLHILLNVCPSEWDEVL